MAGLGVRWLVVPGLPWQASQVGGGSFVFPPAAASSGRRTRPRGFLTPAPCGPVADDSRRLSRESQRQRTMSPLLSKLRLFSQEPPSPGFFLRPERCNCGGESGPPACCARCLAEHFLFLGSALQHLFGQRLGLYLSGLRNSESSCPPNWQPCSIWLQRRSSAALDRRFWTPWPVSVPPAKQPVSITN